MKPIEAVTPVEALNTLNDMAMGFLVSQTFFSACELGVFEELSNGPATVESLARKLKIHPNGCQRLMAALQELGLTEHTNNSYRNTELSKFLTSKSSLPLETLSVWKSFYRLFEFLPDALREHGPRWRQALGTTGNDFFDVTYKDPIQLRRFIQLMNAYSVPQGREIAEHFDFSPYRCVMDIAGGPGSISIQIGLKYPHLRGIVMDVPPVCKVTEEYISANGLSGRFSAQAGNLFNGPYPAGADVATLGWILHDWSDESCRKILHHCYEALPPQGALLVIEGVLNDDYSGSVFRTLMSLHMLAVCEPGARERNQSEYRTMLEEAGFKGVEVVRLKALRDMIIARKP